MTEEQKPLTPADVIWRPLTQGKREALIQHYKEQEDRHQAESTACADISTEALEAGVIDDMVELMENVCHPVDADDVTALAWAIHEKLKGGSKL